MISSVVAALDNASNSRWEQCARNASALWREMREKGFRGQSGVVSEWARRRRLAEKADQSALARTPSARSIARLMTLARDDLSKLDAVPLSTQALLPPSTLRSACAGRLRRAIPSHQLTSASLVWLPSF
ncbi:hypothetical protein [Mesorhizobium xinjiangense]|uniref:hypothetical protein n=1 Tax=Mesorhizobium xinjiangense TaxID=2678685 RepID=UPI0018DE4504|nr:hypothetical protein [Mesorhizobium xinjiangense]